MTRPLSRSVIATCACCALLSCGKPSQPAFTAQAGDTAFADVTVVPMDRDGALEHQTVVVRGDRIVAVEPAARVKVPDGVTRIDGAGKWLMPGLADMHVHIQQPEDLTMFVAAGVTTVRNMWGMEMHLEMREKISRGELLGPRIVTAGPILDGDPPVWPGSEVVTDPASAEQIVADQAKAGYDFIKPYSGLTAPVYDALVAAAKGHGLPVEGHVPRAVGLQHALDAGQRSVEHLDGWIRALVPADVPATATHAELLAKVDESKIADVVRATIAAKAWNCPTLVVMDRLARFDDADRLRKEVRWLEYMPAAVVQSWEPKNDFRMASATAENFATMRQYNAVFGRIAAALAGAGAPLLVGTDAGNPFVVPGASLHDEIELLAKAGVPRPTVLRAATAGAAEFLGERGKAGVVATGAVADLLLVDVDPLREALPLVPTGVMLRGRWLPEAKLTGELAALAKANADTPAARLDELPPLAPEGDGVIELRYHYQMGDSVVGEERLALGKTKRGPVIVAQLLLEAPFPMQTSYRIAPGETSLHATTRRGDIALEGRVDGAKMTVTGTDAKGKAVSLSDAVPKGAFLSGSGMGGGIALANRVAKLKVGQKRELSSVELGYFPVPNVQRLDYTVTRQPDADGHRHYAVTASFAGNPMSADLVVDERGIPVEQTFGPPMNITARLAP